jgi:hypothetical protein
MIDYLIRLNNCKNNPGDAWDRVKKTNIWVCELGCLNDEERDQSVIKLLDMFESDIIDDCDLTLFVNMWEDKMRQPVKFGVNFLKYLQEKKCSVELWR